MEFTLRLKRKNLLDLIAYVKMAKLPNAGELDDEPEQDDKDYLAQSLFHGSMLSEETENRK